MKLLLEGLFIFHTLDYRLHCLFLKIEITDMNHVAYGVRLGIKVSTKLMKRRSGGGSPLLQNFFVEMVLSLL